MAEMAKAQAETIKTESKIKLSQAQVQFDIKMLEVEAQTKRELMQFEFDLNVQLKSMELEAKKEIASGQLTESDITGPASTAKPSKSFESKGNDVLGGFDMSRFEPS